MRLLAIALPESERREILILPILYSAGLINEIVLILWLLVGGPVYRTIYTFWRILEEAREGKEVPWLALISTQAKLIVHID
ncbi:hypothetical protein IQ259_07805 [Fortiea sp. LEGE XX443]|uniref:hypothetical protein n=1 Tax=Fortiea sp. LEGE XX443 TaxID=1828611 RepID=UPI0019DB0557|nr:hypothetical protein [Fortiea sp. LEGE XX443]